MKTGRFHVDGKAPCKRAQNCWILYMSVCTPCCMLVGVVGQSLKNKLLATCKRRQKIPTLLAQHCWPNNVGSTMNNTTNNNVFINKTIKFYNIRHAPQITNTLIWARQNNVGSCCIRCSLKKCTKKCDACAMLFGVVVT